MENKPGYTDEFESWTIGFVDQRRIRLVTSQFQLSVLSNK